MLGREAAAKNNPTQWGICQPSDGFSENPVPPVAIKIPLGLLQRGVVFLELRFRNTVRFSKR